MTCAYCTDEAKGTDEDGEPTCGAPSCTAAVAGLPAVVEESGDDNDSEEE